jgi:hypothetical protein
MALINPSIDANPIQSILWPWDRTTSTQVQRLKTAAVTSNITPSNKIASPSTQGLPQIVKNVSVQKRIVDATHISVTISFTHNANDPYFSGVQIYIRLGSNNPSLVSSGAQSPITFTVARTKLSASFVVQSVGNWGTTDLNRSPVQSVSLK